MPALSCCSGQRSIGLSQSIFLDGALTHDEFLYLARYRHGEIIHELDIVRNLEVCDPTTAVFLDLIGIRRYSVMELDPGCNLLAEFPIRDAEHGDVADLVIPEQEFLDFPRINIFSAADDHVF